MRARAKERDRDRRRSSGNNLTSGMVPRIVRRNERVTERTAAELESCKQDFFCGMKNLSESFHLIPKVLN